MLRNPGLKYRERGIVTSNVIIEVSSGSLNNPPTPEGNRD